MCIDFLYIFDIIKKEPRKGGVLMIVRLIMALGLAIVGFLIGGVMLGVVGFFVGLSEYLGFTGSQIPMTLVEVFHQMIGLGILGGILGAIASFFQSLSVSRDL